MNANDLDYPGERYWEQLLRTEHGRSRRRMHGRHLTELAVVCVCHTAMEEELRGISTDAFSKRIRRWYHRLRSVRGIPPHTRPKLTVESMGKLIAFIREIPRDIRYVDALEGVLVYCIEYRESKLERWCREHPTTPEGLIDPPDIPEGW